MNMQLKEIKLSNRTRRDLNEIKLAWAEFHRSLRTPWTYIPGLVAAAIVAVLMVLPFVLDDLETGWIK